MVVGEFSNANVPTRVGKVGVLADLAIVIALARANSRSASWTTFCCDAARVWRSSPGWADSSGLAEMMLNYVSRPIFFSARSGERDLRAPPPQGRASSSPNGRSFLEHRLTNYRTFSVGNGRQLRVNRRHKLRRRRARRGSG